MIRFRQFQRRGIFGHVGRAHTFVRLLGVLCLVLVDTWLRWNVLRAKPVRDCIPRHRDRLGGHVDAVGPHISNVTGFIQALRRAHGLAGTHAELAAGFLLQGRGHERGRGVAAGGFRFDAGDGQIAAGYGLHSHFGLRFVGQIKSVQLLAGHCHKPRLEFLSAWRGDQRFHAPVFAVAKGFDFHLALDNQPQRDRLHAPRRLCAGQFAPKNRRQVEPHQIIQRTSCQIGLDQRHIHLTRIRHRFCHGLFSDLVKHHAADRRVLLDRFAFGQRLLQVPADRFAFAVGVSREDQCVVVFQRISDGFDVFLARCGDFPSHVEPVFRVDRSVFGRQIADVAVGRKHGVITAEIRVDRFGFGR